jgi:nucleoside phosphorylase
MSGPALAPDRTYSTGIILESWRLWEGIQDAFPARRISDWRLDSDYFELQAARPTAVVIAQGASMAVDALERLAGAKASRVVRLGTTGGLQHSQHVGQPVLPYCAVRGEGTSGYYLPPQVPAVANLSLVEDLAQELSADFAAPIHPCVGWTTDGRWTESDGEIRQFSELGMAVVDMESAALFAAAMRRRVQAASVSIIADLPILHLGAEFKGLPGGEEEWNLVVRQARIAFGAILRALEAAPHEC